jgi:membrane dipeptidase
VDPKAPTLSRWLDHVDHAVAVMGIEHVGLGADFVDQAAPVQQGLGPDQVLHAETAADHKSRLGLQGFTGPEHYPAFVAALRARGYDGARAEAITSGNWLRILHTALPA